MLLVILFLLSSCSSLHKPQPHLLLSDNLIEVGIHKPHVSPNEMATYQRILKLYQEAQYVEAESQVLKFFKSYPHSPWMAAIENLFGLILLQTHRAELATVHFKKAIRLSHHEKKSVEFLKYNLATAEMETQAFGKAQKTLETLQTQSLDLSTQLKVKLLKATLFEKTAQWTQAVQEIFSEPESRDDPALNALHQLSYQHLDLAFPQINDFTFFDAMFERFPNSTFLDTLFFYKGFFYFNAGQIKNAEIHFRALMTRFPKSIYLDKTNQYLTKIQSIQPLRSRTLGILLPMQGKFSRFGIQSLYGIQLAFGIFNTSMGNTQVKLVIEDSGETPESALQALDQLVQEHQVVAVIGPLITKGIDQIAQRAEELGVPLLSLTRRETPHQDYVFQAGLTQTLQAQQMAHYAFEQLKARRFAIIYPNENIGLEARDSFWDTIEKLGGKIVGVESYSPGETDFRKIIDKLSGLFYLDARQRELDLLAQERAANQILKKTRKTEQFFLLKPWVDYDAVFIPDDPQIAGQILPTFAYRDVESIQFLGTSSWHSPDFIQRAQHYAHQAHFLDVVFSETGSPITQFFLKHYLDTYQQTPSILEATAYDAALLLKTIFLETQEPLSRIDIKERLKKMQNIPGATGQLSYQQGRFYRPLTVLSVEHGKFKISKSLEASTSNR